ncbi:MAG: NAD-dependent epimerase/dehydratase family protein, partial [Nitrosopumilaceae archaeon]|nr:NAD(P)-dependent oxidoreductase [Nitrosopumilaceae archaeon]NIU86388.1 NAD-dependent epimerase/dehydratase family protein [Nitrosopumilaceae archaeon]NIV67118.1 NAD-dependent epimerase/dehydratase family protein [Nitrosopumilaceae archaeon]NIX60616.1 NAD-dependent epimerase/dehydratase family protein [Nitrosopumilaceae archaeon]
MKKVFIIGGAGFIGSHLAKHLNGKYEVWINDNFTTGRQKNLEGVEYIDSDIVTGIEECDFIFHLAASVGVRYVNRNPKGAIKNNLDLERQVFEINEIHKKPLFFASTSEVYGNSPDVPYREDH